MTLFYTRLKNELFQTFVAYVNIVKRLHESCDIWVENVCLCSGGNVFFYYIFFDTLKGQSGSPERNKI